MWALFGTSILLSTCSASNQTSFCGCCQEEAVPGGPTERSVRPMLELTDYQATLTNLSGTPSKSFFLDRERRHSDQNQILTITVEDRLADGLKKVIDQYLREMRDKNPASPPPSHHYDYHYDEEVIGAWNLFGPFAGSGATRINSPFQCLWKRCSLGLFSTSGHRASTWSGDVMVMVVAVNSYRQFKKYYY